MVKSSIDEIRERFDNDVERFSNIDTGQVSTIDAPLSLELITSAARSIRPKATELLDIGCGAGNFTIKMLSKIQDLNCTLSDLSEPMLSKAEERVRPLTLGNVQTIKGDIRNIELPDNHYDIILAGAVLHHLRDDSDWETTFKKLFSKLKNGGCLMISDLVTEENKTVKEMIWEKYADYLIGVGGKEYQENVFAYIEKEDSPRSIPYQLELMKKVGFQQVEILHKNLCFGAFCGIK